MELKGDHLRDLAGVNMKVGSDSKSGTSPTINVLPLASRTFHEMPLEDVRNDGLPLLPEDTVKVMVPYAGWLYEPAYSLRSGNDGGTDCDVSCLK